MRIRQIIIATIILASLSACGGKNFFSTATKQEAITPENTATKDTGEPVVSAKQIFNLAEAEVAKKDYAKGLKYYNEVIRLYPGSDYATQATLKSAWAQYKMGKHDQALETIQRYTVRYPNSQYLDYAYWLTGLIYFERMPSPQRDQHNTLNAMKYFKTVQENWPNSEYAKDARVKMDILIDQLAAKEMDIGRQYIKKQNYTAAINRFQYVVKEYETSSHTAEALYRQVEAYTALGLKDEATRMAQVLGHNYPNSKWYNYAYKVVNGQKVSESRFRNPFRKNK
ncbi:MAG: outer membrane protein assembly factor BamD [Alphaproteobacteria bacterium]